MDSDTRSKHTASTRPSTDDVARLRSLILGEDYEQAIRELQAADTTRQVADVLAEAIQLRSQRDKSVQYALAPAIDDMLDASIRRDPNKLVQVITPIIGPSIRSAVRSALADMVESLNRILERSISPQSLWWRVQAWRAGVPFGQFVLLKTLQYRVEQVLLIQRDSGILLHTEARADAHARDPELVSAMLTAINGFVSDSFRSRTDNAQLNRIRFGEHQLLIEAGPRVVIAALVLGDTPPQLAHQLRETLDHFQRVFARPLEQFRGDRSVFEPASVLLQECLTEQARGNTQRPWLAWAVLAVLACALGAWAWQYWRTGQQQQVMAQQLLASGDHVLLDSRRDGDTLHLQILTPFGAAPLPPLQQQDNARLVIESRFAAMQPEDLLLPYLERRYALGSGAAARWQNDTLVLTGTLSADQLHQIQADPWLAKLAPRIDTRAVTLLPPPGQRALDAAAFQNLVHDLQHTRFLFEENSAQLTDAAIGRAAIVLAQLRQLIALSQVLGVQTLQIVITGYADESGTGAVNTRLSRQRAQVVSEFLADNGIDPQRLASVGAGSLIATELPPSQRRFAALQVIHDPLTTGTEHKKTD